MSERLNPNDYYTLQESLKFTPLKARYSLVRYIDKYRFAKWSYPRIEIFGKSRSSRRYRIKGSWIQLFNQKYKKGVLTPEVREADEVVFSLRDLVEYSRKYKVDTIEDLVEKVEEKLKQFNEVNMKNIDR